MELIQIQKSRLKWHAVIYDYIFLLYINFRLYCSIIRGSETEVPLFSTSKIIALLLLHKLRPKFNTSGSIHCDDTETEIKVISSCWQFICLSNFTLRQMGMLNAVRNTVTLLAVATEPTQCTTLLILLLLLLLLYYCYTADSSQRNNNNHNWN